MAGDRGFDPLGLSKPTEYLQVDVSHAASQPPAESAPASSIAAATAAAAPAQHWLWTLQPSSTSTISNMASSSHGQQASTPSRGAPATCTAPRSPHPALPGAPPPPRPPAPQIDELDQNAAKNRQGGIVGAFTPVADQVSTDSLQPYRCGGGRSRDAQQLLLYARASAAGLKQHGKAMLCAHHIGSAGQRGMQQP